MTLPSEETPLILRATEREQVRLYPSSYRGKTRLHLRKFWLDAKDNTWKPSREGIALTQAELVVLMPVLQEIQRGGILT